MRRIAVGLLAPLLVACASGSALESGARPIGPMIAVRLAGPGRVEIDGQAMNLEAFVYDLRIACRAAGSELARRPWLRLIAPSDAREGDAELVRAIRTAAYDAGVQHIELEFG